MLAATLKKMSDIQYPVWCTPKLDGIRCLIVDGKPVSRTLKPIRNKHIQKVVSSAKPAIFEYCDGELLLAEDAPFNEVSSAVMSTKGEPDFKYAIFDSFEFPELNYLDRMQVLIEAKEYMPRWVELLEPVFIANRKEFKEYEKECLAKGYEGVMLRTEHGLYKFGRSTAKQGWLLKWKNWIDDEAVVVGFEERMHNNNAPTKDNLGHTERSSHKENMEPMGTLGALKAEWKGEEVDIGTGFDDKTRQQIWDDKSSYLGKHVKFKYQPHGVKIAPRFPVFLGFRDKEDM